MYFHEKLIYHLFNIFINIYYLVSLSHVLSMTSQESKKRKNTEKTSEKSDKRPKREKKYKDKLFNITHDYKRGTDEDICFVVSETKIHVHSQVLKLHNSMLSEMATLIKISKCNHDPEIFSMMIDIMYGKEIAYDLFQLAKIIKLTKFYNFMDLHDHCYKHFQRLMKHNHEMAFRLESLVSDHQKMRECTMLWTSIYICQITATNDLDFEYMCAHFDFASEKKIYNFDQHRIFEAITNWSSFSMPSMEQIKEIKKRYLKLEELTIDELLIEKEFNSMHDTEMEQ